MNAGLEGVVPLIAPMTHVNFCSLCVFTITLKLSSPELETVETYLA
jgi:hypothetical protein